MQLINVLVVGQTPPPVHGQAIMIEKLVCASFSRVKIFHVRMGFSHDLTDLGRPSVWKILHLAQVFAKTLAIRARHRIDILYYPPSGTSRIAMWRDCALLIPLRKLFPKTVFHFHAAGTSDLFSTLSAFERRLFKAAFGEPDCTIRISSFCPNDGVLLGTHRDVIIPYGINDIASGITRKRTSGSRPRVLFVSGMRESKGVRILIEATHILATKGIDFDVDFVGEWTSPVFRDEMIALVAEYGLSAHVCFRGLLVGDEKHQMFADADIFAFPTFFEMETFGLVAIEAMCFGLPVVASAWRGLPSIVDDGVSGFLTPPRDVGAFSEKLEQLITDPDKASKMGRAARARFLERFTLEQHLAKMEQLFIEVHEG